MAASHKIADLKGINVLVAGAGFAGLAAARALEHRGAAVTVVDARDRVGGRVWSIREGFQHGQSAEGGADFIDSDHGAIIDLAKDLDLSLAPIVRRGFGFYGADRRGRLVRQSIAIGLRAMAEPLSDLIRDYQVSEGRWDSAIARRLAHESVADWLTDSGAPDWVRRRFYALRGVFLADPEDLSLLALVDFFSDFDESRNGPMLRIAGGNDQIATEVARRLKTRPRLRTVLRRVRQDDRRVVLGLEGPSGLAEMTADYLVVALPASTLRDVSFEPALPDGQRDAIAHLKFGCATRVLVQFATRFWVAPGRPNAFGSDQPTGAVWEGNEEQPGPAGILTLLAGGGASRDLQSILAREGMDGVVARLRWLGRPPAVLGSHAIVWDDDPWAKGGYAYFDPGFDPLWRDFLARPAGRIVFAGEHTSIRWQGYMNGAVETGLRAAAEIAAMRALLTPS